MEKVLKGIKPISESDFDSKFNTNPNPRQKFCYATGCTNIATKLVSFTLDGCTKVERYCDDCINSNKHMINENENEFLSNFDDYFIRQVDEPYWSHGKT